MTPQVGFEPTTNRLTVDGSAAELLRNDITLILILCGRYTQYTDSLQWSKTQVLREYPKGADSKLAGQ